MKKEEEEKVAVVTEQMQEVSAEMLSITENISSIQKQLVLDDMVLLKVCVNEAKVFFFCVCFKLKSIVDFTLFFLLQTFVATQDR